jgi:hypothetical protein
MMRVWEWVSAAARGLHPLVAALAVLFGLVLAGVGVSFLALARSKAAAHVAERRARALREECEAALEPLRQGLSGLQDKVAEIERQAAMVPPAPKPGFNLGKRSQALRMHRRGDAPEQIAAALDVRPQEVELLLKVHRIVLRSV